MRASIGILATLFSAVALATPSPALEKALERVASDEIDDWNRCPWCCDVSYYNICTGYVWVWSGWEEGSTLGTVFHPCIPPSDPAFLTVSHFYFRTGAIPGYGFTGTMSVHSVDANLCPVDPPLASQPIFPVSGWNESVWGSRDLRVDPRFAVVHTVGDAFGHGNPATIATDGPFACGNCYPTTRPTRSYTWGRTSQPLCPGSPMFDDSCFVEFLTIAELEADPVSAIDQSWSSVKALYR